MMMARRKEGLSERHKKILEVLENYQDNIGYPPSIREIGREADISSTSVVNYYLDQLEEMGYIERDRKVSRGMRLLKTVSGQLYDTVQSIDELLRIPMAGRIGAGIVVQPPESDFGPFAADEGVEVARSMISDRDKNAQLYALEVQGESMIDAMVNDGDIVIMKHAQEARNGEMVAIRLRDSDETTLKYFFKENGRIRLQPANPTMQPIIIEDPNSVEVQGKVVLVIRQMESTPI
ncbi:MAG TPA: transcriptional repressor LexA [Anaerolineales bacterium]|nr:transcriptional repressor LexA [Anaerolineales bacterium]